MDDMFNNNNGNNYSSGYSNGGNGYFPDGEFRGMYNEDDNMGPVQKGAGLAIAAFVIAIVNIIPCCTMLSVISVPLCIILAIVSLIGKRKGKGFAITAIILSVLAGLLFAYYGFIAYKLGPDYMYFVTNADQIVSDYDEDGTIPERFEKYRDPKYDKYWERSGYKDFDEFFKYEIIEKNRRNLTGYSSGSSSSRTSSSNISDAALVFRPVFT